MSVSAKRQWGKIKDVEQKILGRCDKEIKIYSIRDFFLIFSNGSV
jgi:hypothetical protein